MTYLKLEIPLCLIGALVFSILLTTPHVASAIQNSVLKDSSLTNETQPSNDKGNNSQTDAPSLWEKFMTNIGLYDDNPTSPPQEVKSTQQFGQDYIIGPGDQLGISVWRDDVLSKSVLVLHDGKIQYPLIGEMLVGGKTVLEVKKELTEKLSPYVVDADISVEVKQSNSQVIYIIGRVNAPGKQLLVAETTVMQALAMAGGLTPFAQEDDIRVFRQEKDKTLVYKFRYSLVSFGKHLEDNILLKRGDVIVVR